MIDGMILLQHMTRKHWWFVTPAHAGVQNERCVTRGAWIPAFAGMTVAGMTVERNPQDDAWAYTRPRANDL